MRVAILCLASMAMVCASAAAQMDGIGLYSDAGYNSCELVDSSPGPANIYVVHHAASGATASQFMILENSGFMLTYLGHDSRFPLVLGDPQSGMSVSYERCLYGDILVTVLNYYKSGSSDNCSSLQVVPDPSALRDGVLAVDCTGNYWELGGTRLVVNPDGSCACGSTTEVTNWGRIKDRFGRQ